MIAQLALILAVLTGSPQPNRPAEDDYRHQVVWAVATLAAGPREATRLYEPFDGGEPRTRGVYVGLTFADTECSIGTYWTRRTRAWSPLRWQCP